MMAHTNKFSFRGINLILILLAFILMLNLVEPKITGNQVYDFEQYKYKCYFYSEGELREIPVDRCCYEIQRQIACRSSNLESFDLECYISSSHESSYYINRDMFDYCRLEGYHAKEE